MAPPLLSKPLRSVIAGKKLSIHPMKRAKPAMITLARTLAASKIAAVAADLARDAGIVEFRIESGRTSKSLVQERKGRDFVCWKHVRKEIF
jgi:hypothetical protein